MRAARLLAAAGFLLAALAAQAQTPFPHAGVFPGRLPPDIVAPPSPPPPSLSSPWQQTTVGSPSSGNATSSGNVLTDTCTGNPDFTADTGNLVYQSLSGDREMIGRLVSITADDVWSRNSPMVRQSSATGAKYFAFFFDHRGHFAINWRLATDAHNDWTGVDATYTLPQYWRITRVGSVFSGYTGPTSSGPWTLQGQQSVTMSDPVLWGRLCGNGGGVGGPATQVEDLPTINSLAGGAAGTLAFAGSSASINENGGTYVVHVPRSGGSTGAVGVTVSRDGTSNAALTTDYTTSCAFPCTLSWTNGDTADKTITLTIVNRAGSQASRHLDLSLGSATGGASVGSPSAFVLTINDIDTGGLVKMRNGYYTDCYIWMPHGGDFNHYIGSDGYNAFRACVDWSANQTGVKGVFIPVMWNSLEGDTAGSYDGTVGNGLAGAGKIGFPLIHDMLNYAASKHLTVLIEWDWFNYYNNADCSQTDTETEFAPYDIRGMFPKYVLATSCGGTDASNYYHGGYQPYPDQYTIFTKLWQPHVMDRWIALLNAYAVEFDNDPALEGWILFGEEGDSTIYPYDGSVDGYTFAALDGQFQRIVSEVKPNWPHTDIILALSWSRGSQAILEEAHTAASKAVGVESNNTVLQQTDYVQCAYLGLVPCGPNLGTHNFQGEISYNIWQATPDEIGCTAYTHWGYNTPTEIYNGLMTTGFWNGGSPNGRPLKPHRWILNDYQAGLNYCPSEPQANWGTIGGSGWYNFIQSHPINTTCPSDWVGCNTAQP